MLHRKKGAAMELEGLKASLGKYTDAVNAALDQAEKREVTARIWRKDASLWKDDETHQEIIRNSLGWLTVADEMVRSTDELIAFADEIRGTGNFKHVMLCGMGGSSLCPEVLRQTFGHQTGYPELLVLDSTDPDVLASFGKEIDISHCLFIIASKSGTTTEPLVFYKYWYEHVGLHKPDPGASFVAITDSGTRMVEMATADKFQRIFLNPSDIGGRYSALSYFGMVPAALAGVDIKKLLARALAMKQRCAPDVPVRENPGLRLGVIMGECAQARRDKLTIITDHKISALGLWIEQLVAESSGKDGKGILPVNGEALGPPEVYGDDRLFVSIAVGEIDAETQSKLKALEVAGHPVIYRTLSDVHDLGAEFFLWEMATAVAGWRLGINPFDQPNVQESKDATKALLDYFITHGELEQQTPLVSEGTLAVYADDRVHSTSPPSLLEKALQAHLAQARPGDYIALLDYFEESPEIEATIQAIRTHLRNTTKCATTAGYGPRYLHSTGQLHKGGPNTGVFVQITAPDKIDLPIPEQPYTFSILKQAQAMGDFRSLVAHNRRAIRVDVGDDILLGLRRLKELITQALPAKMTGTG
jgi:glucose-6-phosphate isomerase